MYVKKTDLPAVGGSEKSNWSKNKNRNLYLEVSLWGGREWTNVTTWREPLAWCALHLRSRIREVFPKLQQGRIFIMSSKRGRLGEERGWKVD